MPLQKVLEPRLFVELGLLFELLGSIEILLGKV